jgi:hypothetical protein
VYILMELLIVLFESVVVGHLKLKLLQSIKHIKLRMKCTVSVLEECFILTLIFLHIFVMSRLEGVRDL